MHNRAHVVAMSAERSRPVGPIALTPHLPIGTVPTILSRFPGCGPQKAGREAGGKQIPEIVGGAGLGRDRESRVPVGRSGVSVEGTPQGAHGAQRNHMDDLGQLLHFDEPPVYSDPRGTI